jgi:AraC family transcriptional regulator, regulatory protein of adaptative response / methylated-DNA-[protein]-cysteine methyltransferase
VADQRVGLLCGAGPYFPFRNGDRVTERKIAPGSSYRNEYLHFIFVRCSFGFALTAVSPRGTCAILMGDTRQKLERDLRLEFPGKNPVYSGYDLEGIGARTVQAIETPKINVSLPLDLAGTPFQLSVWRALRAIPLGQSATYSEIASRIGAPNAAPAVSLACLANKIALVVPCHRAADGGGLGYYRWDWSANVWCSIAKPGTRRFDQASRQLCRDYLRLERLLNGCLWAHSGHSVDRERNPHDFSARRRYRGGYS